MSYTSQVRPLDVQFLHAPGVSSHFTLQILRRGLVACWFKREVISLEHLLAGPTSGPRSFG